MTLTLHVPEARDLKPRLTVFGVGGAGGNAVNNMIARSLEGVEFVVANTDAQSLSISEAPRKIQLGEELTEGLGAGAKPEVGARAAEESLDSITDLLMGSHMCFITAGMGGGTGTGAAPIIAQAARQMGILTVGVVTKPFQFEGARRMSLAESGIEELQKYVDTLIVIPNQNLFRIASEKTTFTEAFGMADDVLYQGVKGVTDLMVRPGLVNLDFADIRSVMDEMGKAMMGTGEAEGEDRALQAAENAIANPLLDEISLQGAKGVLINITGGDDMTLHEVDEASNKIRNEVDPHANIIFGSTYDPEMTGRLRVSVVATGIDAELSDHAPLRTSAKNESPQPRAKESIMPEAVTSEADLFSAQNIDLPAKEVEADSRNESSPVPEPEAVEMETSRSDIVAESNTQEVEFQTQDSSAVGLEFEKPNELSSTAEEDELAARREAVRQRLQQAAINEPVTAPKPTRDIAPPSRSGRFGIDTMIRKMSGQEAAPNAASTPSADHHSAAGSAEPVREMLPPRRVEPAPSRNRAEETDRQRVDIPAFLRRKAN